MRIRVKLARVLIRVGKIIQSFAIMIMRTDDLVAFSRQTYEKNRNITPKAEEAWVDRGLTALEEEITERISIKTGKLLLLGIGAGREALRLSRKGFEVTGVDFIPELVERARKHGARHGYRIHALVQEISKLEVPNRTFDVVWLSSAMYSCVPTRKRRIRMLKRIHAALKSDGWFVCGFQRDVGYHLSRKAEIARKIIAIICFGNLAYEKGDILWQNLEYLHNFTTIEEIVSEWTDGGFDVIHLDTTKGLTIGVALLRPKIRHPEEGN